VSGGAFQLTSTLDEDDVEQRTDCGLADGTVRKVRKFNFVNCLVKMNLWSIGIEKIYVFKAEVCKSMNSTDHLPW